MLQVLSPLTFLFIIIERMEVENVSAVEQVQQLLVDKQANSVEIAMLTNEIKGLKNTELGRKKKSHIINRSTANTNCESSLDKYAITIVNSNGKVTSPFATRK